MFSTAQAMKYAGFSNMAWSARWTGAAISKGMSNTMKKGAGSAKWLGTSADYLMGMSTKLAPGSRNFSTKSMWQGVGTNAANFFGRNGMGTTQRLTRLGAAGATAYTGYKLLTSSKWRKRALWAGGMGVVGHAMYSALR